MEKKIIRIITIIMAAVMILSLLLSLFASGAHVHAASSSEIRKQLNFTTLEFLRLDDMIEAIGLEPCKLCTYCWNGKED